MKVLVINAGSSSLKYQLLDTDSQGVLAKGLCERIGIDGRFTYKAPGRETVDAVSIPMPTHAEAIQAVLNALVDPANGVISSMKEIDAVGHRVVHGGETFASSVHQGLHRRDGSRRASGGRVRHRLPPDHAPGGLYLRHPL